MTMADAQSVSGEGSRWEAGDSDARERALDVTRSFLVQAPAGSGKTALLIQRFLALLAHVDRPERIIAMTFTRKAAAEMRERIIGALRQAAAETETRDEHERRKLELAARALEQDRRQAWQLVAHPARLQILTIDALCAGLVRQAPLTSRIGAGSRFEERAAGLHRRAAREALRAAGPRDPDWQNLVSHLDNDAHQTIVQLAGMLARREQWLDAPERGGSAGRRNSRRALHAARCISGQACHCARRLRALRSGQPRQEGRDRRASRRAAQLRRGWRTPAGDRRSAAAVARARRVAAGRQ